jgi:hypothetical protein
MKSEKFLSKSIEKEMEDELEEIDLEGFEVVPKIMFSNILPTVTLKNGSLVFNLQAIKMLDGCSNIQILINIDKKSMIVKPCGKNLFHSVQWSKVDKNGKLIPKRIYGKPFTGRLFYDMYWDFKGTVKKTGELQKDLGEKFLIFEL